MIRSFDVFMNYFDCYCIFIASNRIEMVAFAILQEISALFVKYVVEQYDHINAISLAYNNIKRRYLIAD